MMPNKFTLEIQEFKATSGLNNRSKTFECEGINQNWNIVKGKLNAKSYNFENKLDKRC